ncbi:MAG: tetratricopeptide repeat protein [Reyranella sp.]|nr:tetratricopeptide repeat protein [Reyranella sp.]MBL6652313.1 tetratricopeptide repeat protein [Reyranella sp.]
MSDSAAFHEVDEAVRKDELKEWWNRWGTWIVAAAVIFVVAAAGMVGWRQYDASQRGEASAAYSAALAQIAQDPAAARAAFEKQAKSAPEPYRSLAALIAAQLREPLEAQVTALVEVAPTLSASELSDLANVIAGYKSIDSPKAEEIVAKLEPLAGPDRPFRLSVRELQAMLAVRKGDMKRARELWTEISKDPQVPQAAAQRASAMLNLYPEAK